MKTTIVISDSVLQSAKAVAVDEGTTLRALIEEGLRLVLSKRSTRSTPFRLRDASSKGKGLQAGVDISDREGMAHAIYSGRGT
jgi:hypothetical protein